MLPGKKYRPEDFVRILMRRAWLLLVPFAVVSAATAVVVRKLPDTYEAKTSILVEPQRISQAYVTSSVTANISDRLASIYQQIQSRTRLEHVIEEFNLYAAERQKGAIMEDIVERMRQAIKVEPIKGDTFRITFTGDNRQVVAKVAGRLASLFIEENLKARSVLAEGTDQFLQAQLESARQNLLDHEKKLADYKRAHAGDLPTQQTSNLQAIANVQSQLRSISDGIDRAQDRRNTYEKRLADLNDVTKAADLLPPAAQAPTTLDGIPSTGPAAQRLASARAVQTAMEVRGLKPGHPDLIEVKRLVKELEKKADEEALAAPVSSAAQNPQEAARLKAIDSLKSDIEALDKQIAANQAQAKKLQASSEELQKRLDAVPTREVEMVELTRDYGTFQATYASLLGKREQSKIAANLEQREIGEQFRILDQAQAPERPSSPNRPRLTMMGMGIGIALGLALLLLFEYLDGSFKTDEEVTSVLGLPVLAVVPLMQAAPEKKKALTRRLIINAGLGCTVLGCLAVLVYTFVR